MLEMTMLPLIFDLFLEKNEEIGDSCCFLFISSLLSHNPI